MATSPSEQPASTSAATNSQSQPEPSIQPTAGTPSTAAVEMNTLQSSSNVPPSTSAAAFTPQASTTATDSIAQPPSSDSQPTQSTKELSAPPIPSSPTRAAVPNLARAETEAIGPSTDTPAAKPDTSHGPVVVITLLLTSGARHPYKIDEKYLKKRNVNVEAMDPYNISVYTLKELIWRDWREEWEPRPTSPSSIRLIHFGRMLDDKSPLKDCRFQTESPNVVHMTIKPQEVVDEEENAKSGKGGRRGDGDEETHAGCRCVIL